MVDEAESRPVAATAATEAAVTVDATALLGRMVRARAAYDLLKGLMTGDIVAGGWAALLPVLRVRVRVQG